MNAHRRVKNAVVTTNRLVIEDLSVNGTVVAMKVEEREDRRFTA